MRSKDTGDGRKIIAKVEVPLGVDDIAIYALRYLSEIDDKLPCKTADSSQKREIFNMAKAAIRNWGTEEPKLYITKNNKDLSHFSAVVKNKFPECD